MITKEEVRRRYPVGCEVRPLDFGGLPHTTGERKVEDLSLYYDITSDSWYDNDHGFYYKKGKWAKIVSKPEEKDWTKATPEEIKAEMLRRYPAGTIVGVINSDGKFGGEFTVREGMRVATSSDTTSAWFYNQPGFMCILGKWAEVADNITTIGELEGGRGQDLKDTVFPTVDMEARLQHLQKDDSISISDCSLKRKSKKRKFEY